MTENMQNRNEEQIRLLRQLQMARIIEGCYSQDATGHLVRSRWAPRDICWNDENRTLFSGIVQAFDAFPEAEERYRSALQEYCSLTDVLEPGQIYNIFDRLTIDAGSFLGVMPVHYHYSPGEGNPDRRRRAAWMEEFGADSDELGLLEYVATNFDGLRRSLRALRDAELLATIVPGVLTQRELTETFVNPGRSNFSQSAWYLSNRDRWQCHYDRDEDLEHVTIQLPSLEETRSMLPRTLMQQINTPYRICGAYLPMPIDIESFTSDLRNSLAEVREENPEVYDLM